MAELDNIASQLLKSASEADKIYSKTRDQSEKDKATRLRVIVQNLKTLTLGASDLNGLSDVTISAPANAQVLAYNSTSGQWVNQNPTAGTTPTLAQVTTAGNTTTNAITVGGLTSTGNIDVGGNFVGNGTSQYVHFTGGSGEFRFKNGFGNGWYYTWCQNGSLGLDERMRLSTNNNLLINTTTDAGYKLDVNGTARVQGNLTLGNNTDVSILFGPSSTLGISGGKININNNTSVASNFSVGTISLSSSARFIVGGTVNLAGALGRAMAIESTIVAAANNAVLVGLDINPTFTNGAFTGVSNLALRVAYVAGRYISFTQRPGYADYGRIQFTNVTGGEIISSGSITFGPGDTNLTVTLGNGLVSKITTPGSTKYDGYANQTPSTLAGTTNRPVLFTSTIPDGNIDGFIFENTSSGSRNLFKVIQNNTTLLTLNPNGNLLVGTTTDAGYKLDVDGTARINNHLYLTNSSFTGTMSIRLTANNQITFGNSGIGDWLQAGPSNRVFILQELNSTARGNVLGNVLGTTAVVISTLPAQSSGTSTLTGLQLSYNINHTGTYSGIARGIYYNPTLTSLTGTTHRAIETTSGDVIINTQSASANAGYTTMAIGGSSGVYLQMYVGTNPTAQTLRGQIWAVGNNLLFNNPSAGYLGLYTTLYSGLTVWPTTGNVYVGASPSTDAGYKLDVNGTARVQTSLEIVSTAGVTFGGGATALSWGGGSQLHLGNSATWADIRFYTGAILKYSQTSSLTTITNTTINLATTTVQLAGVDALAWSGTDIRIGSVAAGFNSLSLYVAGSEKARILSTGNVLIGTTTDAGYKLDVVGADSRFNGVRVGLGAGGVSTNTVVGNSTLASNTTGASITAVGYQALKFTTGSNNTAIGKDAGLNNTTGSDNTYVGYLTGLSSASSVRNTYVGSYAGYINNSGNDNVALGFNSLFANASGSNNTAVGQSALASNTASNNTAVGYQAGYSNTTGIEITAIGYQTLKANTTGSQNTAVGNSCMLANTTGTANVALGTNCLILNTTGNSNVAIGDRAAQGNTTASGNVAVGQTALQANSTSPNNTAIGYAALNASTALNNTAVGFQAGVANTTGANNIFIGSQSTGVSATESNRTWIGNSSTTSTWLAGNVLIGTTTDAGYKVDVTGTIRTTGASTNGVAFYDGTYGAKISMVGYVFTIAREGVNGPTQYSFKYSDASDALYLANTAIRGVPAYDAVMMSRSVYAPHNGGFGFVTYGGTTQYKAIQALYTDNNTSGVAFNYKTGGTDTEAMRITSAGFVGVGTSSPSYPFHISSAAAANIYGTVQSTNANGTAAWVAFNDQSDNVVYRVFGSTVGGTQFGQSLVRSASLMVNLGGAGKFLIGSYSGTDLIFGTSDTARLRLVDSTGNFLVGTMTDAGNKLEVSGSINSTGYKINNTAGYTGILVIATNPPGQQNVDIQGGIIVNIF